MPDKIKATISIIIPIYNVARYLRQCLESVEAQTYQDWEAILVDDGSTDESGAIAEEFAKKDPRFRVIHERNRGSAEAREKGLALAKGEYMAFVDSDDWIEETYLQDMLDPAREDDADLVLCSYFFFDDQNITYFANKPENFDPESIAIETLHNKIHAGLWNKLVRRDFIVEHNIHFPKYGYYEDMYVFISLLLNCPRLVFSDKATYHYRMNLLSQTYTAKVNKRITKYKEMISNLLDLIKNFNLADNKDIIDALRFTVEDQQKILYQQFYHDTIKLYRCFSKTPTPLNVNAMPSFWGGVRYAFAREKGNFYTWLSAKRHTLNHNTCL